MWKYDKEKNNLKSKYATDMELYYAVSYHNDYTIVSVEILFIK